MIIGGFVLKKRRADIKTRRLFLTERKFFPLFFLFRSNFAQKSRNNLRLMKLIYFHGFASSGASGTVELLRKALPSGEIIAPDIPVDALEALPMLRELVEKEQPDVIVGTSMGGMYAQLMHGHLRVCVNPAFRISTMSKVVHTGTHKWLNGRKDSEKEFRVTADTIKHFNQVEREQFKGITPEDKELCYGLFGINDEYVNPVNAYNTFTKYYTHAQRFEGGHQLNDKVLHKVLLPLLRQLLGAAYDEAAKEPLPDYMRYQ